MEELILKLTIYLNGIAHNIYRVFDHEEAPESSFRA